MGKAKELIEKFGLGDCTVEEVLKQYGGKCRNQINRSVWGTKLSELVKCAQEERDKDCISAVKILSQLDRLQDKHHPG